MKIPCSHSYWNTELFSFERVARQARLSQPKPCPENLAITLIFLGNNSKIITFSAQEKNKIMRTSRAGIPPFLGFNLR
jgi:hypothetical protein